jgi:hypothetical protein
MDSVAPVGLSRARRAAWRLYARSLMQHELSNSIAPKSAMTLL